MRIRDIRLKIDRPELILNPTNCDPKTISAHLTGAGGDVNTTADDTATDTRPSLPGGQLLAPRVRAEAQLPARGGTGRGDHPA